MNAHNLIVNHQYSLHGDKSKCLYPNHSVWADFMADAETVLCSSEMRTVWNLIKRLSFVEIVLLTYNR